MKKRIRPRSGPEPVGQRNRAQTIQGKKHDGPSVDEWDEEDYDQDEPVEDYREKIRTRRWT